MLVSPTFSLFPWRRRARAQPYHPDGGVSFSGAGVLRGAAAAPMSTMRLAQGIAFDLDGTLIDSRLDIAAACNHILVAAGRVPLAPEIIATFVGDGVRVLVSKAFALPLDAPELDDLETAFVAR